MVAATKNKRGRPRAFNTSDLIDIDLDIEEGLLHRGRINRAYSEIGLNAVYGVFDPDGNAGNVVFALFGIGRTKRRGILEQIGRMIKSGLFTENEIVFYIKEAKNRLEKGQKCKEIEQYLRDARKAKK